MDYLPYHLVQNLERWKNKEWYHQRFDGSPYFLYFIMESEIAKDREKKQGGDFTVHYCFFEQGKADWYILQEDIAKVSKAVMEAAQQNKNISKHWIKTWSTVQKRFYPYCKALAKKDLSRLSDKHLLALHNEFADLVIARNSPSSLIDGFALGTDELLAKLLQTVYEKHRLKTKMRFSELFSSLTAPVHLSFINEAEVSLCRVALSCKKEGLTQLFMQKTPSQILQQIQKTKTYALLKKHQQKYFWIHNNYVEAKVISEEEFIKEIQALVRLDLKTHLKKIMLTPKHNGEKKKQLLAQLRLDPFLKTLITITEDFTAWQDERKKSTFWVTHYGSLLLAELAKRVKIPLELLKYTTARELAHHYPTLNQAVLKKRQQECVLYADINGHEIVQGKKAQVIQKALLTKKHQDKINDFRGLCAMTGKAIGRVVVLKSAKEITKVKQGDILVAVMTRPDYVPAMKKVAAIITDEGGVTSHAAIVSRELKKPCIIGTKIATKVLKDNMKVEVNANHGWVKILQEPSSKSE